MKKPNDDEYMPPGKSVACSSTVSSLNEMIDSSGKKTPSATPLDSSSYDSGAGLTKAEAPSAFATCSAMPPPVRIFRPCTSAMPFTGFLVNICPGPCVNTPSSFTPLYSPTFWKYFQWIREYATELASAVSPAPGSSAMSGRMWRAGVYDAVTYERSTRPSRTASKVPGGADGCFGSIWNFTRPFVTFSTSFAQPCRTTAVMWCWGDTHEDIVSVVCASAGGAAVRTPASAASRSFVTCDMVILLQPVPVAASLESHDPPEPRRLEMSRGHDDRLALQTLHQGPSGLARQLRVHVGAGHPVGLVDLHRAVRRIPQDERSLPL